VTARPDDLKERYRVAFLAYVKDRVEPALSAAYELGREAVSRQVSVLEVAAAHHHALAAALQDAADPEEAIEAAGDFLLESLSPFEMARRALRDACDSALLEKRQATILRRLSSFLADASLATDGKGARDEILQLVAEHGREVTGAETCVVELKPTAGERPLRARASERGAAGHGDATTRLAAALTALDGSDLGLIRLLDNRGSGFSELEQEALAQLAQMASAALERTRLYHA